MINANNVTDYTNDIREKKHSMKIYADLNRLLDNDRTSDSEFIVIYYNDVPLYEDGVIMEYGFDDGRLYIEKDFLDTFSSMYPFNKKESAEFISNWFSKEFEVDVKDSFYNI
jgi:hypothetical protein